LPSQYERKYGFSAIHLPVVGTARSSHLDGIT